MLRNLPSHQHFGNEIKNAEQCHKLGQPKASLLRRATFACRLWPPLCAYNIKSMNKTIIIYSSTDGHTEKICRFLKKIFEESSHDVTITTVQDSKNIDLTQFEKIIIGASVRYGRHKKEVYEFIENNLGLLSKKKNAFFSVNVVARKTNKRSKETNPYVRKFLNEIEWKPNIIGIIAGKINYALYGFIDRTMIRLIMRFTNGPTDINSNIEFTDWKQVELFGEEIVKS